MIEFLEVRSPIRAVSISHISQIRVARLAAWDVRRRKAPSHINRFAPAIRHWPHHRRASVWKDSGQRLEIPEFTVLDSAREPPQFLSTSPDRIKVAHVASLVLARTIVDG